MKLVLDTNVVLDWLVFESPPLEPLRRALSEGRVTICSHSHVEAEFARVLEFPQFERRVMDRCGVVDRYRAQTVDAGLEPGLLKERSALPYGFPRCRDPDDDKFLALAFHARADALVSKDKALLKLRKRRKALGFAILTVQEMLDALSPSADPSRDRAAGSP